MFIKIKNIKWVNYDKKECGRIPKFYSKSREVKRILNEGTKSTILIYIINLSYGQNYFKKYFNSMYQSFAQRESIPKLFLIFLTDEEQANYKSIFHHLRMYVFNTVNVDILEVARSHQEKKFNKKEKFYNFVAHQYNTFSRIYKKQKLTKRVEWFQSKTRNLYGHKLMVYRRDRTLDPRKPYLAEKSNLMTFLKASMNFTFQRSLKVPDLLFCERITESYATACAFLKPNQLDTIFLSTPVILDNYIEVTLTDFLKFFSLIFLFVYLLKIGASFNFHTWTGIAIFKMLLGLDNPSGKTTSILESVLFIFVSFTGFFFSNEFSEAATSILNPFQIERQFKRFLDLKESDITVTLPDEPTNVSSYGVPFANPVLTSLVNWTAGRVFYENYTSMVLFKNVSVYQFDNCKITHIFPRGIRIDGRILARRSDLTVKNEVVSILVRIHSPYLERMSEFYWRFRESGFRYLTRNLRALKIQEEIRRYVINYYHHHNENHLEDDADKMINEILYVLCGILGIGSIVAFMLLLVEHLCSKLLINDMRNENLFQLEEQGIEMCSNDGEECCDEFTSENSNNDGDNNSKSLDRNLVEDV